MPRPYIKLIDEAEADGLLAEEYDAAIERAGKVFNIEGDEPAARRAPRLDRALPGDHVR